MDYQTRMALVATLDQGGEAQIVAVARYAVIPTAGPGLAETAIVVEDRYQGLGLGTILLKRLVAYARRHGISTLLAMVRQENARITRFIRHSGLPVESRVKFGVWEMKKKLQAKANR